MRITTTTWDYRARALLPLGDYTFWVLGIDPLWREDPYDITKWHTFTVSALWMCVPLSMLCAGLIAASGTSLAAHYRHFGLSVVLQPCVGIRSILRLHCC